MQPLKDWFIFFTVVCASHCVISARWSQFLERWRLCLQRTL